MQLRYKEPRTRRFRFSYFLLDDCTGDARMPSESKAAGTRHGGSVGYRTARVTDAASMSAEEDVFRGVGESTRVSRFQPKLILSAPLWLPCW